MAMTVVGATQAIDDTSDNSCAVTRNGIGSGNAVVVYFKGEGGAPASVTVNDGTSNATQLDSFGDGGSNFFTWLGLYENSPGGNLTFTYSLGANFSFKRMIVVECTKGGTLTATTPIRVSVGTDPDNNIASGDMTTTITDSVWFGWHADFTGLTVTGTPQLDGVNADGSILSGFDTVWWKVFTATGTGQAAAVLSDVNGTYICGVMAVQDSGGAGAPSGTPLQSVAQPLRW